MVDPGVAAPAGGAIPEGRRILVVAPAWLGDVILAHSLFKALARIPGTVIDVIAAAWMHPLLQRMPEVHTSIAAPFQAGRLHFKARRRLGRALSRNRYDQAIVLPNSWKSALTPWWAGIPRRTGYVGEQRWGLLNDVRRLDEAMLPMTVQRFVALASLDGSAPDLEGLRPELAPAPPAQRRATAQVLGIAVADRPVLALCPGAEYGPAKRWPAAHYAEVARARSAAGWQVWLLGSAGDAPVVREINRRSGGACVDLAGRTDVGQALDLLSLAAVVVSNDSGLMHAAAALGRPLVAVFGSTDPAHTPPMTHKCRTLYLGLACSPCFERVCPLGHLDCLQRIAPDQVSKAIDELLA